MYRLVLLLLAACSEVKAASDAAAPADVAVPAPKVDPCGEARGLQPGAPWPMRGRCASRVGQSDREGPRSPNELWAVHLPGGGFGVAPVVAADGTIYVATLGGIVLALDPDGSQKWSVQNQADPYEIYDTPAIGADGTVYVGGARTVLVQAISPSGERLWTVPKGAKFRWFNNGPAVGPDGTLYYGLDGLYAIAPDGTVRWHLGDWFNPNPAIGPDGLVYGTMVTGDAGARLVAVQGDGGLAWSMPSRSGAFGIVQPDGVFVGARFSDGSIRGIDKTGRELWHAWVEATDLPALAPDGSLYLPTMDGLYVLAPGSVDPKKVLPGSFFGSPVVDAGGVVYALAEIPGELGSTVVALARDGTVLFQRSFPNERGYGSFAIAEHRLYFVTHDVIHAMGD